MSLYTDQLRSRIAVRQTQRRSTAVLQSKLIHAVADELEVHAEVGNHVFGLTSATSGLFALLDEPEARPFLKEDIDDIELTASRLNELVRRLKEAD